MKQTAKTALWPDEVYGHAIDESKLFRYIVIDENNKPNAVAQIGDYVPPGKSHIETIALVPRLQEVQNYYKKDTDEKFVADLKDFFSSMVALPSDIYLNLMVCFLISTCFFEQFSHSPILWLFSEPGTGKTRFGNLLTYISLYGVRITGVREAHVIRYCENYRSELFFDCTDLSNEMKRGGTVDILLNRFEKGAKYMRVNDVQAGSYNDIKVYHLYGPTIIATNFGLPEALQTRSIRINMQKTEQMFDGSPSPENCLPFKERLLALKLRHAGETMPVEAKLHVSRLGDIVIPLQNICRLVGMDDSWIPQLIEDQLESAKTVHDVEDVLVAEAFLNAAKKSPSLKFISTDLIYKEFLNLSSSEDPLSSIKVGMRLTKMGVKSDQTGGGRGRVANLEFLEKFCAKYGFDYNSEEFGGLLKVS